MSVLALNDAKSHLNISGDTHNAELQDFIDAAEAVIAAKVGPLEPTTVTARVSGGTSGLALPITPVISLTSLTIVGGSASDVSLLYANPITGVVGYNSGSLSFTGSWDVVYQAGRTTCPQDLLLAVKELVRHLWATQRATARPGPAQDPNVPGAAHMLPYRVAELIAPHMQIAGFA